MDYTIDSIHSAKTEQDDDWFQFWSPFVYQTIEYYDFDNRKWKHLPFEGGFREQQEKNPFIWNTFQYIITKIYKGNKDG